MDFPMLMAKAVSGAEACKAALLGAAGVVVADELATSLSQRDAQWNRDVTKEEVLEQRDSKRRKFEPPVDWTHSSSLCHLALTDEHTRGMLRGELRLSKLEREVVWQALPSHVSLVLSEMSMRTAREPQAPNSARYATVEQQPLTRKSGSRRRKSAVPAASAACSAAQENRGAGLWDGEVSALRAQVEELERKLEVAQKAKCIDEVATPRKGRAKGRAKGGKGGNGGKGSKAIGRDSPTDAAAAAATATFHQALAPVVSLTSRPAGRQRATAETDVGGRQSSGPVGAASSSEASVSATNPVGASAAADIDGGSRPRPQRAQRQCTASGTDPLGGQRPHALVGQRPQPGRKQSPNDVGSALGPQSDRKTFATDTDGDVGSRPQIGRRQSPTAGVETCSRSACGDLQQKQPAVSNVSGPCSSGSQTNGRHTFPASAGSRPMAAAIATATTTAATTATATASEPFSGRRNAAMPTILASNIAIVGVAATETEPLGADAKHTPQATTRLEAAIGSSTELETSAAVAKIVRPIAETTREDPAKIKREEVDVAHSGEEIPMTELQNKIDRLDEEQLDKVLNFLEPFLDTTSPNQDHELDIKRLPPDRQKELVKLIDSLTASASRVSEDLQIANSRTAPVEEAALDPVAPVVQPRPATAAMPALPVPERTGIPEAATQALQVPEPVILDGGGATGTGCEEASGNMFFLSPTLQGCDSMLTKTAEVLSMLDIMDGT